jgi:hypothetical protein
MFAHPWWVNLLLLVPIANYIAWRRRRLALDRWQMIYATVFAVAFGFVEAAVVVYLRAAAGLLPGYWDSLAEAARHSRDYDQVHALAAPFPQSLLTVEMFREAATILMLVGAALLAAPRRRERWALFLWCFAVWDIVYYAGLWLTVRWPQSLATPDVLFLLPQPWISAVWFPVLVSALCLAAILLSRDRQSASS